MDREMKYEDGASGDGAPADAAGRSSATAEELEQDIQATQHRLTEIAGELDRRRVRAVRKVRQAMPFAAAIGAGLCVAGLGVAVARLGPRRAARRGGASVQSSPPSPPRPRSGLAFKLTTAVAASMASILARRWAKQAVARLWALPDPPTP